jgi:hypothetical protein
MQYWQAVKIGRYVAVHAPLTHAYTPQRMSPSVCGGVHCQVDVHGPQVPVASQTPPPGQEPQSIVPPQPSGQDPHCLPSWAHVDGVQHVPTGVHSWPPGQGPQPSQPPQPSCQ